jgi:small conductance mechanosensitive channel
VRYGAGPVAELEEACGLEPSLVCREVYERSGSERWAEVADIAFSRPLTILVVLLVAWVAVLVLRRVIDGFVARLAGSPAEADGARRRSDVAIRAAARAETLGHVLRSIAAFTVWTIAGLTILGELGINLGPLIAGAGIAGIALGFGAQSLVKDFLAGIFILIEDQYGVGDVIDVGELSGTLVSGVVESVSLRSTRLRATNGTVWHVPNGTILRVGNMSQQWARALLDVSVAYRSDLEQAQAVIKAAADAVWQDPAWSADMLEEPELWGVEHLGPEGVTIRLVVKTKPAAQFGVLRELRARIKAALDAAGIEGPTFWRTD